MGKEYWIQQLNAETRDARMAAVYKLKKLLDSGKIAQPKKEGYTNNHVHTRYSFSPYSPAKAVWMAVISGLNTVGIIDHDAINGATEFIEAGQALGIPTTIGFEIRTDWADTRLIGRRINNPDQIQNAYISAHGLPHTQIEEADAYLNKVREARHKRNRAMISKLNDIMRPYSITVDYDSDVLPLSYAAYGGEVTERHLLFALACKLIDRFGKGQPLIGFVESSLGIDLSEKQRQYLSNMDNDIYDYDLLNVLKGSFVSQIYIDTNQQETPPVQDVVAFIKSMGAIPTYCYLGDVAASPTGDKKAQKFEDDYLQDVFDECKRIGFQAIAFMPSRNTSEQLDRVMAMCNEYGFMQISGEDINQPRQSFICRQLLEPAYAHLIDTTWALVGHEKAATENAQSGMFANGVCLSPQALQERTDRYKVIGMEGY